MADIVIDPTYPYIIKKEYADLISTTKDTSDRIQKNDDVVLFRKEITCSYIFGDKDDENLQRLVSEFKLHP